MKTSKFVQLDPQVLMEYIYDDTFLDNENYIITHDLNEDIKSYSANNSEGSVNRYDNQYVVIDPVTNKVGIRNSETYNFLQDREYSQTLPIRYDRIKLHFPVNYNFDNKAGCYVRIYAFDYNNQGLVNLSQYYFDKQDQDRFNKELSLSTPPITLNGKLWGKFIELSYPSPLAVSKQRTNNLPNPNSINYNLTGGIGISQTAPVMIEFGFINQKNTINNLSTFLLGSPFQTSVPLTPDFENLAIKIEESEDGDWFEFYGTYNGSIGEFNNWINTSLQAGKRYYVEYVVTLFEENIKGRSQTIQVTEDFGEKLEYRPIIKYSSTTAAIEIVMRVIDKVDGSIITRRGSYGILPDQISKYSRSLVRINVNGIKTPKIYNLRNGGSIFDAFSGLNKRNFDNSGSSFGSGIETIRVPFPLLVSTNNVVAKSESSLLDGKEWKGFGKLKIIVQPFDNLFKFILARNVENKVEYFNLLNVGTFEMYFKNFDSDVKTTLYRRSDEVDLERGTVVFKLNKDNINKVRRIYQSGVNMFYITTTNEETNETTVIYEGTFIMSDSIEYVNDLAKDYQDENDDVQIIRDTGQETAIVTRRRAQNSSATTNTNQQIENDSNRASLANSLDNVSFSTVSNNNTNNSTLLNDFENRSRGDISINL